jgi:hypothetical protein
VVAWLLGAKHSGFVRAVFHHGQAQVEFGQHPAAQRLRGALPARGLTARGAAASMRVAGPGQQRQRHGTQVIARDPVGSNIVFGGVHQLRGA